MFFTVGYIILGSAMWNDDEGAVVKVNTSVYYDHYFAFNGYIISNFEYKTSLLSLAILLHNY